MSKLMFQSLSLTVFLASRYSAQSQGLFVNLDFEAANVQNLPYPGPGELVDISDGVPGWNTSPTAGLTLIWDNISFSPTAIPEPSILAVLATGTVLLAWRAVRRLRGKDKPTRTPA